MVKVKLSNFFNFSIDKAIALEYEGLGFESQMNEC